ncbi:glycosyl hydrolase family 61-domain-containing protein [Aspergillus transmontanensis]|uniref:AA9 family lytic polysaccharide monooxygenase n=1 Tax=Aspergillus transmontanensis TaxID=1034304 RepID=A0A5N6W5E4_9EURO|nr:glycosyl hydrolase family 61-domain-containing protein [Aspergillus transmontanensis]
MKLSLLAAVAIVPLVSAHYFFDTLIINGQEISLNQYIRSNTRPQKYNPIKWVNTRDNMTPDMPDFRCNKSAFIFAGQIGTAEIKAGSKLTLKLSVDATIKHPDSALIYKKSVCDKNKDFTTDVLCTWDKDCVEFTVPADLPNGEYLIRPEYIGVHGVHVEEAEFYYTCAQVKIVGGGNGTSGSTVEFPGAYKKDNPSFNFSIYGGYKDYPMPGPEIWTAGSGDSTSSKVANTATFYQEDAGTCSSRFHAREHARDFSY